MRLCVTGAAGFIGSHLTECLLQQGHEVIGLDNFHPFYAPAIKRANLATALTSPLFTLVEGDLRDEGLMHSLFERTRPDVVVHLAAMAGVRPSIQQPGLYYDVNVRGTLNLLEGMRRANLRSLVFASSSSVYGKNPKTPFSETDFVDNPISPYAATKKAGELLCHTWHHLQDMSIACLRFFTVYGPRQRPDLAIHSFARLMRAGKPLPFFGDGSTRRDYTYVDDIVKGVLGAIAFVSPDQPVRYDVFNLGESRTVALHELVSLLEQALGCRAELNRLPDQPGDVPLTFADIRKAREILGYHPDVPIEEGIARFVAWLRASG